MGLSSFLDARSLASRDTELVALGVGHGDPAVRALLAPVEEAAARFGQLGDDRLDVLRADPHVQVHPVLDGLALGHLLEQDPLARAALGAVGVADRRPRTPDEVAAV